MLYKPQNNTKYTNYLDVGMPWQQSFIQPPVFRRIKQKNRFLVFLHVIT